MIPVDTVLQIDRRCHMPRVVQAYNLQIQQACHQPGEQYRPVFAVGIRIKDRFFGEQVILLSKLLLVCPVSERGLNKAQQEVDRFLLAHALYFVR